MLTQETTDYARPIIFTVETELLDLEQGPALDDGWPTTVKTQVSVCRSKETSLSNTVYLSLTTLRNSFVCILIHINVMELCGVFFPFLVFSSFPSGTGVMKMTIVFQTWCYNLKLI